MANRQSANCEDYNNLELLHSINPLNVPCILEQLLKFFPLPCLRILRSVSADWKIEVDKAIRRRQVVCLNNSDQFSLYREAFEIPEKGHRQFRINDFDFTGLLSTRKRRFWELFGPKIAMLEFTNKEIFWNDILHVVGGMPRITKLILHHTPRSPVYPWDKLPPPVTRSIRIQLRSIPAVPEDAVREVSTMFKLFPRLHALSFHTILNTSMQERISSILIRAVASVNIKLANLADLGTPLVMRNCDASLLRNINLPLETLSIRIAEKIDITILGGFFSRLSNTLRKLTICFPSEFGDFPYTDKEWLQQAINSIGSLKNLTLLRLDQAFGRLYVLQDLHHLREIGLTNSVIWDALCDNNIPVATSKKKVANTIVNKISIENDDIIGHPYSTGQSLGSLLNICNNIISLELEHVDDFGLRQIYLQMPQLKLLHLSKAKCTDAGVTGISTERLALLHTAFNFASSGDIHFRQYQYIGSLQNLKDLTIKGAPLTDRSLRFGVWDCKQLTTLRIQNAMITNDGLDLLRKKIGSHLEIVDVSDCPFYAQSTNVSRDHTMSAAVPIMGNIPEHIKLGKSRIQEILKVTVDGLYRSEESDFHQRGFWEDWVFNEDPRESSIKQYLTHNKTLFKILGKIGARHFQQLFMQKQPNDIPSNRESPSIHLISKIIRVPRDKICQYPDLDQVPTQFPQVFINRLLRSSLTINDIYEWLLSLQLSL